MICVKQRLFYDVRHGTLVDDLCQTMPFSRRLEWNTCGCLIIFGRTDLRKGVSRANKCQEARGDIRLSHSPSNPDKKAHRLKTKK